MKVDKEAREAKLALTGDLAVERLDKHDQANPGYVSLANKFDPSMI